MLKRALVVCVLVFTLQACASFETVTVAPTGVLPSQTESGGSLGWHSVAFKINWPEEQAPAWHVDAYLAHRICADILDAHRSDMLVWRFHRRAAKDPAGHRFSFKFYGDLALARSVYAELEDHPQTGQLLASGIVSRITYSALTENELPRIADTSDPGWPPPVRASWPYFAMGVSQSWLELIGQVVQESPPVPDSQPLQSQLEFYKSVNEQVSQFWRLEGGHAYLHHLNALFGYEEVIVRERRATRF